MHLVTLCENFGADSIFSPTRTRYLVITGSSLPLPKKNKVKKTITNSFSDTQVKSILTVRRNWGW